MAERAISLSICDLFGLQLVAPRLLSLSDARANSCVQMGEYLHITACGIRRLAEKIPPGRKLIFASLIGMLSLSTLFRACSCVSLNTFQFVLRKFHLDFCVPALHRCKRVDGYERRQMIRADVSEYFHCDRLAEIC
ncbi:hypothetical protein PoB_006777800 [Plakobranchus ocellatus]|uniref:Uncharacterized protein n=1 Tax=Plakobranchus ocellatus TaxID=259542 RepID=A0AAV4DB46_9GAST|nr:hypothetical protein PoB_006777800 [Plakobranchus ocellatus]